MLITGPPPSTDSTSGSTGPHRPFERTDTTEVASRRERERRVLSDLRDLAGTRVSTVRLFEELGSVLPQAVGFDAVCWHDTDPLIGLPTSMVSDTLDPRGIAQALDLEFTANDVGTVAEMQAKGSRVTTISQVTHGHPERSIRMREQLSGYGFGDELRLRCDIGAGSWGFAAFMREKARGSFTVEEIRFADQANRLITTALRHSHLPRPGAAVPGSASVPAVVILGSSNELVAADRPGQRLIAELADSASDVLAVPTAFPIIAKLARIAEETPDALPAELRVQTRNGHWVVLRGSVLHGATGPQVAISATAPTAAEIMPVVLNAHGLTPREQLVIREVLGGGSTKEIAKALSLTALTVQDHLKSIFTKFGAHSRGELVARLSFGTQRPDSSGQSR
ncbi:helix-turn-helix transcriptional regulator [Actinoalloteichus hymeniacidonis]|uniref:helix-turn-helix transcriptional regulator n=1 Tax=Actinoalloteichus hymeniacidonis TaxID=340345 RepID=UPI001560D691|nr:helix-turn-helix transcriptional regulator [Actinoalloteichus hymeniacidonis]MBB5908014.1 DNA-binding CsgD family transcriptional regulator [Actinoalloteichus hymeniacidonis]